MKNLFNKNQLLIASAVLVVAFGLFGGASLASANASPYFDPYYSYPASYPNSCGTSNGYWYTNCPIQPPVYQPPVYQPPVYQPPVYVPPPVVQYQPLTAYCYSNSTSVQTGTSVQWTAYASGGTGGYTYSWNSTDGFYGSGQSVYFIYNNPGTKNTAVTIYSGTQTVTINCSPITVYQNYSYNYNYNYTQPYYGYNQTAVVQYAYGSNNNSGLDIGCFADPVNAAPNQPVTWSVEVTGGLAPYSYSWTGSDGLTGSQSSILKYYQTTGDKSAIVTVTSADGKSGTKACSNSLAIRRTTTNVAAAPAAPVAQAPANAQNQNNGLGAASYFSLNNVPWGWVAVLVILVLFATVVYLLFNRPKI